MVSQDAFIIYTMSSSISNVFFVTSCLQFNHTVHNLLLECQVWVLGLSYLSDRSFCRVGCLGNESFKTKQKDLKDLLTESKMAQLL